MKATSKIIANMPTPKPAFTWDDVKPGALYIDADGDVLLGGQYYPHDGWDYKKTLTVVGLRAALPYLGLTYLEGVTKDSLAELRPFTGVVKLTQADKEDE